MVEITIDGSVNVVTTGQQGPQGPQGETGNPGSAATIAVGTTTTGSPGSNASVTNSGSSSAAVFNFTVPRGDVGATGNPGTAATVNAGTTVTGNAGTNASVTNSGTSSAAVFNFTIPRGDKGSNGARGADGAAATIAAGTTTTGSPGSNASVTNSGSSSAAVFNFTIPRGDVGPNLVNGSTSTTLNGILKGNGSTVSVANNLVFTDVANTIAAASSASIPLILKSAVSQSANLQEWQNNSSSSLGYMTPAGLLSCQNLNIGDTNNSVPYIEFVNGGVKLQRGNNGELNLLLQNYLGASFNIVNANSSTVPLTVKGAVSQTANLQEWQNNSGTVLANISSAGLFNLQVGFQSDVRFYSDDGLGSPYLFINGNSIKGPNTGEGVRLSGSQDGVGGSVQINGASSANGLGGSVNITAGDSSDIDLNKGGNVNIYGGAGVNGGDIVLTPGQQYDSGLGGNVKIRNNGGNTVFAINSDDGKINTTQVDIDNTVTGLPNRRMPIYDIYGVFQGYIPIYF